MTTYQTGTAFRRALEDRLLAQSQQTTPAASEVTRRFLEPVLRGSAQGVWSPREQAWTAPIAYATSAY